MGGAYQLSSPGVGGLIREGSLIEDLLKVLQFEHMKTSRNYQPSRMVPILGSCFDFFLGIPW